MVSPASRRFIRYNPPSVHQPRHGSGDRHQDERQPRGQDGGAHALPVRREEQDRQLHRQQPGVTEQLPLQAGRRRHQEGAQRHDEDDGGGCRPLRPDGDGEERPPDEHRHEHTPARLEHDRPVGIPGDAEIDHPEPGQDQPGQGAEDGKDADGEQAHRRMITHQGRAGEEGQPGPSASMRSPGKAGAASRTGRGEELGHARPAAPDVGGRQVDVGHHAPGAVGRPPQVGALLVRLGREVAGRVADRAVDEDHVPATAQQEPGWHLGRGEVVAEAVPASEEAVVRCRGVAGQQRPPDGAPRRQGGAPRWDRRPRPGAGSRPDRGSGAHCIAGGRAAVVRRRPRTSGSSTSASVPGSGPRDGRCGRRPRRRRGRGPDAAPRARGIRPASVDRNRRAAPENLPGERTTPGLLRGAAPRESSCTRADWTNVGGPGVG
jgi:hypothetical protein